MQPIRRHNLIAHTIVDKWREKPRIPYGWFAWGPNSQVPPMLGNADMKNKCPNF